MNKDIVISTEVDVAQQLRTIEIMCRQFGWRIPECYVHAARMELLDMAATEREQMRHSA